MRRYKIIYKDEGIYTDRDCFLAAFLHMLRRRENKERIKKKKSGKARACT